MKQLNSVCKQIDWAPTWSSVSADKANLHMGNFTQNYIVYSPLSGGFQIWEQYVELNGNNFIKQPTRVERAVGIEKDKVTCPLKNNKIKT